MDGISIEDGAGLLSSLGFNKLDNLTTAEKGEIGEAIADRLARERGLTPLSNPKASTTPGVDAVYRDTDGNLVVVEVKFTSSDKNTGLGQLRTEVSNSVTGGDIKQTQLTEGWLMPTVEGGVQVNEGALKRSVDNGIISQQVADEIKQSIANGTLKTEAVIVRNGDSGAITSTLGSVLPDTKVTQVNLGRVIN